MLITPHERTQIDQSVGALSEAEALVQRALSFYNDVLRETATLHDQILARLRATPSTPADIIDTWAALDFSPVTVDLTHALDLETAPRD